MSDVGADLISPAEPPVVREPGEGALTWVRRNLFRSPLDGFISVISAVIAGYVIFRLGRFVLVTGRWSIIRVNLRLFMTGRYPVNELWRVAVCCLSLTFILGVAVGSALQRQRRELGPRDPITPGQRFIGLVRRVWPLLIGVGLLLSMTTTVWPSILVVSLVVAFIVGRVLADRVADRYIVWFIVTAVVAVGVLVWMPNEWPKVVVLLVLGAAAVAGAVLLPAPPVQALVAIAAAVAIRILLSPGTRDMLGAPLAWVLAIAVVAAAVLAAIRVREISVSVTFWLVVGSIPLSVSAIRLLTRPVGWDGWGGMMVNLFLAIAGISLCFPLGILLALGRRAGRSSGSVWGGIIAACVLAGPVLLMAVLHGIDFGNTTSKVLLTLTLVLAALGFVAGLRSSLPVLRVLSVAYVELIRGMPLYVLLLVSASALGFFLPENFNRPAQIARAIAVFTLFTAAYIAEIVRGGLQSLPNGQTEAAQALGLSPVKTTGLIVLPQALRNVIPAIVGQFISLFKDTTLAGAAMGLPEMFQVREAALSQEQFDGARLIPETIAFVAFVFWIGCITMSRESQRLERKLGVGTR